MKNSLLCMTFISLGFVGTAVLGADGPQDPGMLSEEAIVLPEFHISEKVNPRKIYSVKIEKLWDNLGKQPTIRYIDVLNAAYDTSKFDLMKCMVEKKNYRDTVAKERMFLCNYGAAMTEVPIKWLPMQSGFNGRMRVDSGSVSTGAGFSYKSLAISLQQEAPLPALLHASGASLSADLSKRSYAFLQTMTLKSRTKYMQTQVNFELQLQDLNRFFAMYIGRPIMSPLEALYGLAMMGLKPDVKMTAEIFHRNGIKVSDDQLAKVIATGNSHQQGASDAFDLAFRLVNGVSAFGMDSQTSVMDDPSTFVIFQVSDGLRQMSGQQYAEYFEKILFEAPGHI